MPTVALTDDQLREALRIREQFQTVTEAAAYLGLPRATYNTRLTRARQRFPEGYRPERQFEAPELPSELPDIETLLARRKAEYQRRDEARSARKLIPIKIKTNGPIGIVHFGDPHVDDPGTDIATLERHADIVSATDGMFAANCGDSSNNWIGRLARLYAEQSTTHGEAWLLVEWLFRKVDWLYAIAGNHDCWSGEGDPIKWVARHRKQIYEAHGVRCNLLFPNGKEVRINARHDFSGQSIWNTAHGVMKAAQAGWRDHILTAGHRHISGYGIVKCPATGLLSHAIRVASYKIWDDYAEEKGLPDQNIAPAVCTIINPEKEDGDPGLVNVFHDIEAGADFLSFLRKRG